MESMDSKGSHSGGGNLPSGTRQAGENVQGREFGHHHSHQDMDKRITRKSFRASFTRASFAGLLLVAGAAGAQAQKSARAASDARDFWGDFPFDAGFSAPAWNDAG